MGHHHDSSHQHTPEFNKAFLIAIVANGSFVVLQVIFAAIAHSTSLFADAIHNLGDVSGLMLAWIGNSLLKRGPTKHSTYGLKKISILAALANGILLVFTCGIIATEAIYKFFSPTEVQAVSVMIVAAIGILVNSATAFPFLKGSDDLNIRGAFLHLIYDAFISVGVVVAAFVIYWTQWQWVDPLVGLIIALLILKGTWFLFADSFRMIIDGVPRGILMAEIHALLMSEPGVAGVHDLHVWALSTQENALSAHLWMPEKILTDESRYALAEKLKHQHKIQHITIQVERAPQLCQDSCIPYI